MKKRTSDRLYKKLFYLPGHGKIPNRVYCFKMIASLLTIIACIAAMASSAFAFFYQRISTENSTITAAYYSVSVDNAQDGTYICPLAYEDKHTFKITANGSATTGYCKIQIGDAVYYSDQIPQGEALEITVFATEGTVITFTPRWGTSSYYVSGETCKNEIIHSQTSSVTHVVEQNETLTDIATHYGVSKDDILTYNNIMELTVGYELKIPRVGQPVAGENQSSETD